MYIRTMMQTVRPALCCVLVEAPPFNIVFVGMVIFHRRFHSQTSEIKKDKDLVFFLIPAVCLLKKLLIFSAFGQPGHNWYICRIGYATEKSHQCFLEVNNKYNFEFNTNGYKLTVKLWSCPWGFTISKLTHCGLVTTYGVVERSKYWLRQLLIACSAPNHCLNQFWLNHWTGRPCCIRRDNFTGNETIYHWMFLKITYFMCIYITFVFAGGRNNPLRPDQNVATCFLVDGFKFSNMWNIFEHTSIRRRINLGLNKMAAFYRHFQINFLVWKMWYLTENSLKCVPWNPPGSNNGLVPSGNKPLPLSCRHMASAGRNALTQRGLGMYIYTLVS